MNIWILMKNKVGYKERSIKEELDFILGEQGLNNFKYGYLTEKEYKELIYKYDNGLLEPSPKQKLVINPRVAYVVTEDMIKRSIPINYIEKNKTLLEFGDISRLSFIDPVANLEWDFLYVVNADVFRETALNFNQSKKVNRGRNTGYTQYPKGTTGFKQFWKREFDRIIDGFEPIIEYKDINGNACFKPCGLRITGEFYFYLNYCPIEQLEVDKNDKSINKVDFPKFLLQDYYYFLELDARENPSKYGFDLDFKKSIILAKSRRKGFSLKCAAGACRLIAFFKKTKVIIASESGQEKTDAALTAKKIIPILDHLSSFTPFGRKDVGDVRRNGGWKNEVLKLTSTNVEITLGIFNTKTKEKKGRQSTVSTITLSKPDAIAGEGIQRVYIEESGKIANLSNVWTFTKESLKAGSIYRGIAVVFGTGGDMKSSTGKDGNSKQFSILYNTPEANDFAAYRNIYDYQETYHTVGYFVSDMWSNFGSFIKVNKQRIFGLDAQGNPLFWVAEIVLNKDRLSKLPPKGKIEDYNKFLTQRCKTPSEAFYETSSNFFNSADLIAVKNEIEREQGGFERYYTVGELVEINGVPTFVPDLENKLEPILTRSNENSNKEGALLIYEKPIKVNGQVMPNSYLISVDPVRDQNSGSSHISIIVFKTPVHAQQIGLEGIVARYTGRKRYEPMSYVYRLMVNLSKYYNALITYENDQDGGILQHFTQTGQLDRLLPMPSLVTKKYLPNSSVTRSFGHQMSTEHHKRMGELLLKEWLDRRHTDIKGVNGDEVVTIQGKRNVELLKDRLIIEELIDYNRQGNFDNVLAFMGIIIQYNEYFSDNVDIVRVEQRKKTDEEVRKWINAKLGSNNTFQNNKVGSLNR